MFIFILFFINDLGFLKMLKMYKTPIKLCIKLSILFNDNYRYYYFILFYFIFLLLNNL